MCLKIKMKKKQKNLLTNPVSESTNDIHPSDVDTKNRFGLFNGFAKEKHLTSSSSKAYIYRLKIIHVAINAQYTLLQCKIFYIHFKAPSIF